jgi:U6 snRNA-associated Sm-like protein LSm6
MELQKKNPADFLKLIKGNTVMVKLNDGTEYRGTFICLDGCLNVVLEKCEERSGTKVLNKFTDLFIRGNNVLYIAPVSVA